MENGSNIVYPQKNCKFSHDPECKLLVQDDLTLILIDEKGKNENVTNNMYHIHLL